MKQLIWCAIAGKQKVIQIDVSACKFVYDLQKAVAYKTRYKVLIPRIEIWKVHNPCKWKAQDRTNTIDFSGSEDDLRKIATQLVSHEILKGEFDPEYCNSGISIIARVYTKRKVIPLLPHPTRLIWCAIAGETRIMQVDIPLSDDLSDVRKAISKVLKVKSSHVGTIWKVKDPLEWSLNEAQKKLIFPGLESELEKIATPLEPPLENDQFDELKRYYYIYLIVSVNGADNLTARNPERFIWCITQGEKRTFQLDISGCSTTDELLDAAVAKAGFKIDPELRSLWAISEPDRWPITEETLIHQTLRGRGLTRLGKRLLLHKPIGDLLNEVQLVNTDKIGLILAIAPDGPQQSDDREYYFTWCAIGPHNRIARVDITDCDNDLMILRAIEIQSGYMDMKGSTLWKINDAREYRVRDVAIGLKPIPNEIARLEEIASPAQTQQEDTSDTDLVGEYISYFLHISASNSRSSSEPRLRPFVERNDILKELEILGFNDENIDINTSRPHVATVTKIDGGDQYYAKYLNPYHFSEINTLKYLSKFDAPHVPTNITYRKLEEGALLLIPYLGESVECYDHLSRDLLSITSQFLEGVAFLHSKFVAHMDLKPSHVLVNKDGLVFIIDYDLSLRFKDTTEVTSGYQGTKGYTAPEVGEDTYNPFLADIWSAGRVIYDLYLLRRDHEAARFLNGISKKMMADDPMARLPVQSAFRELKEYMERLSQKQCPGTM